MAKRKRPTRRIPMDKVVFRSRERGTVWCGILDAMEKLKKNECLVIPLDNYPVGTTARQVQNRLTAAQARFGPTTPTPRNTRFQKRTTDSGDVAVCVVKA